MMTMSWQWVILLTDVHVLRSLIYRLLVRFTARALQQLTSQLKKSYHGSQSEQKDSDMPRGCQCWQEIAQGSLLPIFNLSPCSRVLLVMILHKEIPLMLRHTIYVVTCLPYKASVIRCYTMFFDLRILESCKLLCPVSSATLPAKLLTLWVKIRQLFALASSWEQNVATQPKFLSLNNLRRLIKTHYLIHFRSQAYWRLLLCPASCLLVILPTMKQSEGLK